MSSPLALVCVAGPTARQGLRCAPQVAIAGLDGLVVCGNSFQGSGKQRRTGQVFQVYDVH